MAKQEVLFGVSRLARDLDEYLEWVDVCDKGGIDLIGFGDSQTLWADSYAILAATALRTKKARLGPMVTNPITRHPTVAANAIATVQKLSHGRAFFAIGPGDSSVYNIGAKPLSKEDYEAYVTTVRGLTHGKEMEYQGNKLKLNWELGPPVPLWLAGDGPKNLQLAGRIADGVIVGNSATPELVHFANKHIRAGAEQAGRDFSKIDVWHMIRVLVAPTEAEGIERLKFYLASYTNVRFRKNMNDKGITIPPDIQRGIQGLRNDYRMSEHVKHETTYNADLIDKWGLKEFIARQMAITGPPEHCVKLIQGLVEVGATKFVLPQIMGNQIETTRDMINKIVPAFR